MAQKFVSLEEAATQLGISKDRLNELREDGKIRAYRDGASWKFRSDDVEKLAADGIPAADAGSDISLGSLSSLDLDDDSPKSDAAALPSMGELSDIELSSDLDLDLGDDQPLEVAATSDLNLDDLDEPTLPVEGDAEDEVMLADDDVDELSDSILLSENELGESTDRPPSTIIGKAEMAADLDLDLPSDSAAAAMSDVRLADASTSNVFNPTAHGDALDALDADPPGLGDTFGDLDELEIDLEAESSRILAPEDVTKAQEAAAKAQAKAAEMSDLELAASDSSPSGVLDSMAGGSGAGLSGLSELELDSGDDDDGVLGDGSDITLSSESSGINIISPSDSGLALDEVPLELGSGSPLASGLDLGPGSDDAEVGLEPLEVAEDAEAEPFALTPFGEEAGEDEEDSSQVIPLDEVSEEDALLGGGGRSATAVDGLGDDFAAIPAGAMMPVGEPAVDLPFSMANIAGLSMCMLLLMLCGMMVFDLLRNMWSWGEVYTLNSSLMDVLTPILG